MSRNTRTTARKPVCLPKGIIPRYYQELCRDSALQFIVDDPDTWHLFKSPTGTGKSFMILMIMEAVPDAIAVTPRVEIIADFLGKLGYDTEDLSDEQFLRIADSYGLFTPIRLRNLLAKGELPFLPSLLIVDECHHDLADSYQDIVMYLNGVPKVGVTATPYRGTPRDTARFLEQWGNVVHEVLTLPEACEQGYCSFPDATIWPLVDDDIIEVSNGEIKASAADKIITDRLDALVDRVKKAGFYCKRSKCWDRATMFAFNTRNLVHAFVQRMQKEGIPVAAITDATPRKDRTAIFDSVERCNKALVQIDVVSEGVDRKFRRIIDSRPTMSPRKWVQQIGREMRPIEMCKECKNQSLHPSEYTCSCEPPPEYICCCRNLERHGYLMEGMLPISTIKEAQEAFGKPSKRAGMRALGMEGFGKFLPIPVETVSGLTCTTYNLIHMEQFKRTEYFAIIHPNYVEPVFGQRESHVVGGEMRWGRWRAVESLPDLKGCHTAKEFPLTETQRTRWNELAEKVGLNPHKPVTNRNIQVLFFLRDIGRGLT